MKSKIIYMVLAALVLVFSLGSGKTLAFFTDVIWSQPLSWSAGTLLVDAEDIMVSGDKEASLVPGECTEIEFTVTNTGSKQACLRIYAKGSWRAAYHRNTASLTANYNGEEIKAEDKAHYSYGSFIYEDPDEPENGPGVYHSWFTAKAIPQSLALTVPNDFNNQGESSNTSAESAGNNSPPVPGVSKVNQYLIVGMGPGGGGDSVNIGSSQEIGANRQTLSGGDPGDPGDDYVSPIEPDLTLPYSPADPDDPNLRDVFFENEDDPFNPDENRWLWDADKQAHYLPGNFGKQYFLFRGVDWSGDVAVTSPTGKYSLSNINVFGSFGFRTSGGGEIDVTASNSYYFQTGSLQGVEMNEDSPDPGEGWVGNFDHIPLLEELRDWRDYIRSLPAEGSINIDIEDQNSTDKGIYVTNVAGKDTNGDGIVVIDINRGGSDFKVDDSDWIIKNSAWETEGKKLVIFRIRGEANMLIGNSSIMIGEGLGCGSGRLGALFVKVHPEEEFNGNVSGSSDTVFNANNMVINGIGFWDLNTIGDAGTDRDLNGKVDRSQQNNYTKININDAQGCGQFISPYLTFNDVRFTRCTLCEISVPDEPGITLKKEVSVDGGNTWFEANNPLGPEIDPDVDPKFRFTIKNTGNVTLTNIILTDDTLGQVATINELPGGETRVIEVTDSDWQQRQVLDSGNVTIGLCADEDDWTAKDDGYFYYDHCLEKDDSVTICLKLCMADDPEELYRGAKFTVKAFVEAVQASHNAKEQLWGND